MEKLNDTKMPKVSAWQKIQIYFNLVNHVLISIVAVYMSFLCYRAGSSAISWHAWLCTIGVSDGWAQCSVQITIVKIILDSISEQYQLLMTQAILAFYSQNVWSQYHSQPVKRRLHWVLQAIGSSMAIIGMIIEYWNRRTHFQTKHSIIGLIAGILTLISMFNGVSALWSIELRKYVAPIYMKYVHILTGTAAFVLGEFYFRYEKLPALLTDLLNFTQVW